MANRDIEDGLLGKYAEEAIRELSRKNWHTCSPNALILVCHQVHQNSVRKIVGMIKKPLYFVGSVGAAAVIWMIISDILGLAG